MKSVNTSVQTLICDFKNASNAELAHVCGPIDGNIRAIETALDVTVGRRTHSFTIKGLATQVGYAQAVLRQLMHRAAEPISPETVALELAEYRNALAQAQAGSLPKVSIDTNQASTTVPAKRSPHQQVSHGALEQLKNHSFLELHTGIDARQLTSTPLINSGATHTTELKTRKAGLAGRTDTQRNYISHILTHDLTFGVGPAGTGKTYLAVACAVDALERDKVQRIVLTRPAVEAGERLGFLPGDLASKIDPYLRPLYDALYDLMGYDKTQKLFEKQAIEIAPLAYMRGRTLNNAFIILDEAQNTTCEQMKMFLTRTGFGSKVVVTGDMSQVDLPRGTASGLRDALTVLAGVQGIAVSSFASHDVVRHPLVGKIVDAYENRHGASN